MKKEDTISAIATPPGVGALGIIRISGSEAFSAADKIFNGKIKLSEAKSHTIHYGNISDNSEVIDDVLISVFRAPNSYTGEDSVEISFHGNPLIAEKITQVLLKHNVKLAQPGEFTKRAYLNNRLDLSQAEAVADIINSRTDASLKGARNQLNGVLSAKVAELREMLLNACSYIEIELDFAEEDIEFLNKQDLVNRINKIMNEIDELLKSYQFGKVIRDGINLAITGEPNVGKSSLLNLLLKESRAIVSDVPGTTRDVIREEVSIDGILYRLYDTAGLRSSTDFVEKEGISRSIDSIKTADITMMICDTETGFTEDVYNTILEHTTPEKVIKVLNKIDLNDKPLDAGKFDVKISALKKKGIEELLRVLQQKAFHGNIYTESSAVVTNARHFDSLTRANSFLKGAIDSVNLGLSGEFISVDLRNAISSLGEIIGEVSSEDVLNNIFMKFCIGK